MRLSMSVRQYGVAVSAESASEATNETKHTAAGRRGEEDAAAPESVGGTGRGVTRSEV